MVHNSPRGSIWGNARYSSRLDRSGGFQFPSHDHRSDSWRYGGPISTVGGSSRRVALTLTEVLIALAITLVILLGMTQAFTSASREIGIGRNRLLVTERIRSAADLIRDDLQKLSLNVHPMVRGSQNQGYFEIVDGGYRDMTFLDTPSNVLGDIDDILMFTAVSPDVPFRGRFDGRIIESPEAEIIYFTRRSGTGPIGYGEQIRLYRRVLLIRPDLTAALQNADPNVNLIARSVDRYNTYVTNNNLDPALMARSPYAKFLQFNDVSLSWNPYRGPMPAAGPGFADYRANSLGLLSNPQNRTAHLAATPLASPFLPPAFPHPVVVNGTPAEHLMNVFLQDLILESTAAGSDVVLENVVGFDVKVFDPTVPVYQYSGQPLLPHDSGYAAAAGNPGDFPVQGFGAYVDLGSFEFRATDGYFVNNGVPVVANDIPSPVGVAHHFAHWRRRLADAPYNYFVAEQPANNYWNQLMGRYEAYAGGPTYTTWTSDFEKDGLDNDGDGLVDEGADGVPHGNALSGVRQDRDSAPPYSQPITSIQVTLRSASFAADRQQIRGTDQVMQTQVVVSTINQ